MFALYVQGFSLGSPVSPHSPGLGFIDTVGLSYSIYERELIFVSTSDPVIN